MPVERSAGAVIFRKEGGKTLFLLLHYPSSAKAKKDYWDFPKGHIEKGEDELETVRREILEETGLDDLQLVEGFKEENEYFFKFQGETIFKTVSFYLAETQKKEVNISSEHIGYEWLVFEEALGRLTFKNTKEILTKASNYLKIHG